MPEAAEMDVKRHMEEPMNRRLDALQRQCETLMAIVTTNTASGPRSDDSEELSLATRDVQGKERKLHVRFAEHEVLRDTEDDLTTFSPPPLTGVNETAKTGDCNSKVWKSIEYETDLWVCKIPDADVEALLHSLLLRIPYSGMERRLSLAKRLTGDYIEHDFTTSEELGRDVTREERDMRLLTLLELILPEIQAEVAARIARETGFCGMKAKDARLAKQSSREPSPADARRDCQSPASSIGSVWGEENAHHPRIDVHMESEDANTAITSTEEQVTPAPDGADTILSEEYEASIKSQTASVLSDASNEPHEDDGEILSYAQLIREMRSMRQELHELREKVRSLEKGRPAQGQSNSARPRNSAKRVSAASEESQKKNPAKGVGCRGQRQRLERKGNNRPREHVRPSNWPSSAEEKRQRNGGKTATAKASQANRDQDERSRSDQSPRQRNQRRTKGSPSRSKTRDVPGRRTRKKRCWICDSKAHVRRNCLEAENPARHISKRARRRLECWECGRMTHWKRDCPEWKDSGQDSDTTDLRAPRTAMTSAPLLEQKQSASERAGAGRLAEWRHVSPRRIRRGSDQGQTDKRGAYGAPTGQLPTCNRPGRSADEIAGARNASIGTAGHPVEERGD